MKYTEILYILIIFQRFIEAYYLHSLDGSYVILVE